MARTLVFLTILAIVLCGSAFGSLPRINEFMASNGSTLADEDGDFPDWIEIHNPLAVSLDMDGWHLTDRADNLTMWRFPSVTIPAGGYLVVFASGKDRALAGQPLHTNFSLSINGEYLALVGPDGQAILHEFAPTFPQQYRDISYGMGGLGYFTYFHTPTPGGPNVDSGSGSGPVISEFMASNGSTLADQDGDYSDWIEIHNPTASPVNLNGWRLTDRANDLTMWRFPSVTIPAGGYLVVFASGKDRAVAGSQLHTNFSLSSDGEYLALVEPDGATVAHAYSPQYPQQFHDISYGLFGPELRYFTTPTPGTGNIGGLVDYVREVSFSVPHGIFYDLSEAFTLELSTATPGATIWYTVNGDDPTDPASTRTAYTGPITLDRTRVIRAAATRSGYLGSRIATQTYIFLDSVLTQSNDQSELGYPDTWYNTRGGSSWSNPDWFSRPAFYALHPDVELTKEDLLSIPTMALTLTGHDLFDPAEGIYVNPIERARNNPMWEKPASLELIYPDGAEGFSVNAGARISGELARWVICNAKFGFRILFKSEYGPTNLVTDLFPNSDVDRYNTIIMRSVWGESWLRDETITQQYPGAPGFTSGSPVRTTYLRDQVAHDIFAATGQAGIEGRFVHLYLNGLYWGLYQVVERPDDAFNAEHFGGEREQWDIIKGAVGNTAWNGRLHGGTRDAWDYLFSYFDFNGSTNTTTVTPVSDATYEIIKQYLDLENFADMMIAICYIGRYDFPGKNWYAAGLPGAPGEPMIEPFRFYLWDSEASLSSLSANRTTLGNSSSDDTGPVRLYRRLRMNKQFQMLFADRVRKHFFNGGSMSPEGAGAIFQARVDEIYDAIVGESARWGHFGANRRDNPLLRDVEWIAEINWFTNTYFPQRTNTVLNQFRQLNLFPSIDPPVISPSGGKVDLDDLITITAPTGVIWYTTDGHDPRAGSGDNGTIEPPTSVTLAEESAPKRVLIPTVENGGDQLGATWLVNPFDDSEWIYGTGGVGYDRSGTNYDPYYSIDVIDVMNGVNTSAFIRIPFTVDPEDLETFDYLTLGIRVDDGFVAYLNGVKIAEENNLPDDIPGVPKWDNGAVTWNNESEAVMLRTWSVGDFLHLLVPGENVLAIHGLNAGLGSSDFLLSANLVAGSSGVSGDPDGISPTAVEYTGPFGLPMTSRVKARAYHNGEWSALTEATFVCDVSAVLRVSEIHYEPVGPTPAEAAVNPEWAGRDFEFIELTNTGDQPIGLLAVRFVDGIYFDFSTSPITTLAPGGHVVVASNIAAFQARYGTEMPLAGAYIGQLSNSGERITIADTTGAQVQDFRYGVGGDWPVRAAGMGASLEIVDPAGDYDDAGNWRSSTEYGGSPGVAGLGPVRDVVINEVLTHTDYPQEDMIELHNVSGSTVDLSGWYLSDRSANYRMYRIPDGTLLPPGGYVVFSESDFNVGEFGFALSSTGEEVWLMAADADGNLTRFVDHVEFGPAFNGMALGRYPNGHGELTALAWPTFGLANAGPYVSPVIISEIQYQPAEVVGMDEADLEFLELYNHTGSDVPLDWYDANGNGVPDSNEAGWALTRGVRFDFPVGTTVPAGGRLVVVGFDPTDAAALTAFCTAYDIPSLTPGVDIVGPWEGRLSNTGERVRLAAADGINDGADGHPMVTMDEVRYGVAAPWPEEAGGYGASLHRVAPSAFGNFADSWVAAPPSPGDLGDIGLVPGDINGDGRVDLDDFVILKQNFGRTDATRAEGDLNGDGVVGLEDFVIFKQNFGKW